MGALKVFPILLISFCTLHTSMSLPKRLLDYNETSEMVTVPVVTSASSLSPNYTTYVDIPKECVKLGFCEYAKTYPKEIAQNLINKMKATGLFPDRNALLITPLSLDTELKANKGDNPCSTEEKPVKPFIARDTNGDWIFILNSDEDTVHAYDVEICAEGENPPLNKIMLETGYEATCIEKYIYVKMFGILDENLKENTFRISVACSCVAVTE
ncbi:uncharacterized protein [Epargyreus clarus]|uniref:uncharacterized protein n=1 Tax=Epargyreus clarus TaxID=520877 RepID=UPI003C2C929D